MPPVVPPLKTSSGLLAGIGACSGNSTETVVLPLPMIALLQMASAVLVSVACSWPLVQVG